MKWSCEICNHENDNEIISQDIDVIYFNYRMRCNSCHHDTFIKEPIPFHSYCDLYKYTDLLKALKQN